MIRSVLRIAEFSQAFTIIVTIVPRSLIALTHNTLRAVTVAAAASKRDAVFVRVTLLVALYRMRAFVLDAASGRAFETEVAGVILALKSMQTYRWLYAGVVTTAKSTLLTPMVILAVDVYGLFEKGNCFLAL